MRQETLKSLKKRELFKRKPDATTVFIRDHYERAEKRYCCSAYDDINREVFLKGITLVWVGFDF